MSNKSERARAIILATLMLTSVFVAPVAATPQGGNGAGGSQPGDGGSAKLSPLPSNSFESRVVAFEAVRNTELKGDQPGNDTETVRATFDGYVDLNRTQNASFGTDRKLAARYLEHDPNVSVALAVSDRYLAAQAIADAERAQTVLDARGTDYDEATVNRALEKANRAYEKGRRLESKSPVAAIEQYEIAYRAAQTALDEMDDRQTPEVTISSRADPINNGSQNYTVVGTVFDVRTTDIENVTIRINDRVRTVPLRSNATPGTKARFSAEVALDQPIVNITIVAVDPLDAHETPDASESGSDSTGNSGGAGAGQGNEDSNGANEESTSKSNVGTATLLLDGDGLPDTYEETVVGTDPLDPDSNSVETTSNESNNGVADGREDFDGDDLPTIAERNVGTDPLDGDTDGDDLPDFLEIRYQELDPLKPDSDGDGIRDGAEDFDDDGLTNAKEADLGTNLRAPDTDADGLNDSVEDNGPTAPTNPDTDDDGLLDGEEPIVGTNPTDPDTDDDGVLDGNETFTTTATNETLNVSVDAEGEGYAASGVEIHENRNPVLEVETVDSASVSRMVVVSGAEQESLNVTIPYDSDTATETSDLAMFRYNETLQTFVQVDSTVNASAGTVTGRSTRGGRFTVFEVSEWQALFDDPLTETYSDDGQLGDSSVWECGGTNGGDCETGDGTVTLDGDESASTESETSSSGTIGLLFSPGTPTDCIVRPDGKEICDPGGGGDGGDDSDGGGGGSIGDGGGGFDPIDDGTSATNETYERTIQFPNAALIELEYELFAEAVGDDAVARFVIETESDGERTLFSVSGPDATSSGAEALDLKQYGGEEVTFRLVAENESTLTAEKFRLTYDTDGDGLTDAEERNGMRTGLGQTIQTDPTENDTDGDGLDDDEEMGEPIGVRNLTYYPITSDPTEQDTDRDGLDDFTEVTPWNLTVIENENGDPYKWAGNQTSGENVDNISLTSDPRKVDTDGDGLTDATEKRDTHTDPREQRTYNITREHQVQIVDALANHPERTRARWMAQGLGLIQRGESLRELENTQLMDRTDDFDLVTTQGDTVTDRVTFRALDQEQRSDTWFSNVGEYRHGTDLWDPDTDDDGLTDGQEVRYVTRFDDDLGLQADSEVTFNTNATDPDSDEDGYWDGWIGVYGTGRSDNVVLYMENIADGNGIEREEMVSEQTGVHNVTGTPIPGADIYGNDSKYHSNLHMGELYWDTEPVEEASTPAEKTQLTVEVDYVRNDRWPSNGSPFELENQNGTSLIESIEKNYALYGINLTFVESDEIPKQELSNVEMIVGGATGGRSLKYVSPEGLNRRELGAVEREYHDDNSHLHMLWGTKLMNDQPKTVIDDRTDYDNATGVAQHVGSPDGPKVRYVEKEDFGIMVARDQFQPNEFHDLQSVGMHELGHALSIGWRDDAPIPIEGLNSLMGENAFEVYSGNLDPNRAGGIDESPEMIATRTNLRTRWSVMKAGTAPDQGAPQAEAPVLAFSIQELSTADFADIPSKSEEDKEQ